MGTAAIGQRIERRGAQPLPPKFTPTISVNESHLVVAHKDGVDLFSLESGMAANLIRTFSPSDISDEYVRANRPLVTLVSRGHGADFWASARWDLKLFAGGGDDGGEPRLSHQFNRVVMSMVASRDGRSAWVSTIGRGMIHRYSRL